MPAITIMFFAASLAFGQTSRVFQLRDNQSKQTMEQLATMLSVMSDIPQVSIDDIKRTLTVEGTVAQVAMADWLVRQLDLAASASFSGVQEYRPAVGSDDLVRVFYPKHAGASQQLQEMVMTIRVIADIRRLFIYPTLNAVAVRGTGQQISLAAWLVDQLDQPGNAAAPAPREYKLSGDDVARVFELTYPQTPQQLQEIAMVIRAVGDISKVYINNGRRAITVRTSAERVALAGWLVSELDKPMNGQPIMQDRNARHEYRLTTDAENLVRVFYLAGSQPAQDHQKVASQVRSLTGMRRLFLYNARGALATRGTVGQVATAERVLEELKAQ